MLFRSKANNIEHPLIPILVSGEGEEVHAEHLAASHWELSQRGGAPPLVCIDGLAWGALEHVLRHGSVSYHPRDNTMLHTKLQQEGHVANTEV